MNKIIKFDAFHVEEDTLFGHSSFFMDSFESVVETIVLPKTSSPEGGVTFTYARRFSSSYVKSGKQAKIKKYISSVIPTKSALKVDSIFIDLRINSPSNLSHALMIHLPIVILAEKFIKTVDSKRKLTLIFPENLPTYISKIFECQGYEVVLTDNRVNGDSCLFDITSWTCLRGTLPSILKSGKRIDGLKSAIVKESKGLPRKIFISRKGTRSLKNEADVEARLSKAGYSKVYLEEYDIFQQFALVVYAESIVAIHGAALGVLVLKSLFPEKKYKLIELFPPSHLTNVYRILTHQLNGRWVGVRGKIWKELLPSAYSQAPGSIRSFSLSSFEVCMKSVECALTLVDDK